MKRIIAISAIVTCALATVAAITLFDRDSDPIDPPTPAIATAPSAPISAQRKFAALLVAPHRTAQDNEELLEQSDAIRAQLEEQGEPDVGAAMRTRLREVEVDEEEARAWFEEHRETFGSRSFAQSRHAVERLIAIERVRDEFELEAL